MQGIEQFIVKLSDIVWGVPLLILLCGTHLFLSGVIVAETKKFLWSGQIEKSLNEILCSTTTNG